MPRKKHKAEEISKAEAGARVGLGGREHLRRDPADRHKVA